MTASVRTWSTAARLAVDLAARGRLLPSVTPSGLDAWRLGPLDPSDAALRHLLIDALPPAAHARVIPGSRPVRVGTPAALVDAFSDAVADLMPRTAAAPIASGHNAFATTSPTPVVEVADRLASLGSDLAGGATTALRLQPPDEVDGPFTASLPLQSRLDPSLVVDARDLWTAPDPCPAGCSSAWDVTAAGTASRSPRAAGNSPRRRPTNPTTSSTQGDGR